AFLWLPPRSGRPLCGVGARSARAGVPPSFPRVQAILECGFDARPRAASGILDQINELADLGLIPSATIAVRVWNGAPQVKLYIINNDEVFFGFYPVVERTVTIKNSPVAIYDLLGKDVPLFHYTVTDDDEALGTQFVHVQVRAGASTGDSAPP